MAIHHALLVDYWTSGNNQITYQNMDGLPSSIPFTSRSPSSEEGDTETANVRSWVSVSSSVNRAGARRWPPVAPGGLSEVHWDVWALKAT